MSTIQPGRCPDTYMDLSHNSANAVENGTASSIPTTPLSSTDNTESNWTNSFVRFDRMLSGGALEIIFRILDIIILCIGISSGKNTCTGSSHLAVTSICLLVFCSLDLAIIVRYFIRNLSSQYQHLTEEEKIERYRRIRACRTIFTFFKLIPVCVGIGYALSSSIPSKAGECELMRFCLGVVCLSTLLSMLIPQTKPEIPPRRSLLLECLILSFFLIINGIYFGTVASAMSGVEQSTCKYNQIDDIYLRAPLKTYAYFGLILFGSTTGLNILHLLISQTCNRVRNGRRLYSYYYALQYTLTYLASVVAIYYFSVGGLWLYRPRNGEPCKSDAPGLYRTLLIWQWIRILYPLIAVPLVLVLCCLGVVLGVMLSYCLPASITVPLLEVIRVRIKDED